MTSIQNGQESTTELRLDYKDLLAGRLTIVIDGLPRSPDDTFRPVAAAMNGDALHGAPVSPLAAEADAIYVATAYAPALGTSLVLAAWRGQEARACELIAATIEDANKDDAGRATALADYARALLCNGLGQYQDALAAAERACLHEDLGPVVWALLELVEAGARTNTHEIAGEGLNRIDAWAQASGTNWALGVRARSAAVLSEGVMADRLYQEAIDLLSRSRSPAHLARAQLVYGEWLRRENRRVDARVQLRAAHETFSRISAEGFARRALRELLATGETARKRTDDARDQLTPQEAQIARLAQDGLSNPQIGARLFISPRTVQYHLRKVFRKLEISSRHQLGRIPADRLDVAA